MKVRTVLACGQMSLPVVSRVLAVEWGGEGGVEF